MSFPVVWLPEAEADLTQALATYESIRPELGLRFLHAVADTVDEIADGPLHFVIVGGERRRAGVHRFPYGIFFQPEETRIVVIALLHGRRDPRLWKLR